MANRPRDFELRIYHPPTRRVSFWFLVFSFEFPPAVHARRVRHKGSGESCSAAVPAACTRDACATRPAVDPHGELCGAGVSPAHGCPSHARETRALQGFR